MLLINISKISIRNFIIKIKVLNELTQTLFCARIVNRRFPDLKETCLSHSHFVNSLFIHYAWVGTGEFKLVPGPHGKERQQVCQRVEHQGRKQQCYSCWRERTVDDFDNFPTPMGILVFVGLTVAGIAAVSLLWYLARFIL